MRELDLEFPKRATVNGRDFKVCQQLLLLRRNTIEWFVVAVDLESTVYHCNLVGIFSLFSLK